VARPGTVVTNAHVVAGQDDTVVQVRGVGPRLPARTIAFDPRNDIAVLQVGGLDAEALPFASDTSSGRAGAVLGFPRNGPYDVRAARLGQTSVVLSQDAYGNGPLRRSVTSFRGVVRPGNSGGPLLSESGEVLATVFAATRGSRRRGGFGVPNDVVRRDLRRATQPVGTGPCSS
jgi:S1-C subfamily serine protease